MATSKQYTYYIDGRRLALLQKNATTGRWGSPTEDVTSGMKLEYRVGPTDPTDETSVIDIDSYLAKALVEYIKSKIFEESGDEKRAEYYMKRCRRKVGKYASRRVAGMSFEGLRTYTGDEVGNLVIGQMGFAVVDCAVAPATGSNDVGTHSDGTPGEEHANRTFVAIKVMKNSSANSVGFEAETILGDNITIADVSDGDIIYGPFSYIQAIELLTTDGKLICYFGNSQ